jgi:DNA-binding NarL/FixJ family response regulator
MKRITVLLAEDHMVVREGLRNLLKLVTDFEVVGEAPDGRQAATKARTSMSSGGSKTTTV